MTRETHRLAGDSMRRAIEGRLRSATDPEELRYAPRPLPATVAEARALLGERRSGLLRSSWLLAPIGAVALVIAVVALSGGLDGRRAPSVGSDVSPSATPVASTPATVAPTDTASPRASAGVAGCGVADFGVSSDRWGAAAGSRGTNVIFRVVESVDECRLGGQLAGRISDATGAVLVESLASPTASLILHGGDQVEIGVQWSNWCGAEPVSPLAFTVTLPGDATPIALVPPQGSEILVPPCMGGGQPTNLSITAFQSSSRPAPEG